MFFIAVPSFFAPCPTDDDAAADAAAAAAADITAPRPLRGGTYIYTLL
jgi:hypothetical protein